MDDQEYDEAQVIEQVASRLRDKFPERDEEAITAVTEEVVHEFIDAPVKNYVGPLAEHQARDVLRHSTDTELTS
jgi:hypothetical protein